VLSTGSVLDDEFLLKMKEYVDNVLVWYMPLIPKWLVEIFCIQQDKKREEILKRLIPMVQKERSHIDSVYLKTLMQKKRPDGSYLTDQDIALGQVATFAGGIINSAVAVANQLLLACEYPDMAERLRKELEDTPISESKLLSSWGMETARVSGGILHSIRMVDIDGFEFGGVPIPKGSVMLVDRLSSSLNAKEFPEQVKFDPENFPNDTSYDFQKYAVLNWGAGIHKCPGRLLAMKEMKIILAMMLQQMKLTSAPGKPLKLGYLATSSMAHFSKSYVVHYKKNQPSSFQETNLS